MTIIIKETIIHALNNHRGDDLERAKSGFRGLPDSEMDKQYGQSGKTRRQMIAEYQQHVDRVEKAIREVEAL